MGGMVQLCYGNIHIMDYSAATNKNKLSLCVEAWEGHDTFSKKKPE